MCARARVCVCARVRAARVRVRACVCVCVRVCVSPDGRAKQGTVHPELHHRLRSNICPQVLKLQWCDDRVHRVKASDINDTILVSDRCVRVAHATVSNLPPPL